ncbi:Uncharacterised protein [Starkeya nomas]|uniref:Uncharacterized protein n=1 Tax=Starkeya nomas TaxID=2666134 RepID=A0A5S9Q696_9HYPH|nr:hypothetical protein [Starkeya nomas]CAA0112748.1 Uncharacterised protein [Starkeya nomas]
MPERVLDLARGLSELRLRLDRAAAIAAGAQTCADAFKMILELDLDVLIGEAQTLLDAISMRSMDASAPG